MEMDLLREQKSIQLKVWAIDLLNQQIFSLWWAHLRNHTLRTPASATVQVYANQLNKVSGSTALNKAFYLELAENIIQMLSWQDLIASAKSFIQYVSALNN